MRRWLSVLFAVVMLASIHGGVSAAGGDQAACHTMPTACAARVSGDGCACCGTPAPGSSEVCSLPGSQCERSMGGGVRADLFDRTRAAEGPVEALRSAPEPQPWPAILREAHGRRDALAPLAMAGGTWTVSPPEPGGRGRLARLRIFRI